MTIENLLNEQTEKKMEKPIAKEKAKQELFEKFGFSDTNGFKQTIKSGDIETAKNWLMYIVDNRELKFSYYLDTWDSWLRDRQAEIKEAEEK